MIVRHKSNFRHFLQIAYINLKKGIRFGADFELFAYLRLSMLFSKNYDRTTKFSLLVAFLLTII
jgi:hypothetical protein